MVLPLIFKEIKMQTKFIFSTLAMAVALAFTQANAAVIDATSGDDNKVVTGADTLTSFQVSNGHTGSVTGDIININSSVNVKTEGRPNNPSSSAIIGSENTQKVTIQVTEGNALDVSGSNLTIRGQNIEIETKKDNLVYGHGSSVIGGEETNLISISGGTYGLSLLPYNSKPETNGTLTLTAKTVDISASNSGLWAQNNSTGYEGAYAQLTVNADNIVINAGRNGVVAMSQGAVELNGNVYINAENAVLARGLSKVAINKDSSHTVQLNGNINFNYDKATSGTGVDADITINLSNENSYWNGNTVVSWGEGKPADPSKLEVNQTKLSISNGAQWNVANIVNNDVTSGGSLYIPLNQLTLNNGVINVTEASDQKLEIEKMFGTGGSLNLLVSQDETGLKSASVSIDSILDSDATLNVNYVGITSDDIQDANVAMDQLYSSVDAKGAKQIKTISEGDIKGAITQTIATDGTKSAVKTSENTKLASFRGLNATALVAWRDEVAYTNQRMEFLRDNSHAYGAWAQVYGGESKYEDKAELTTTTVQVGADMAVGDWVAGAAFSYMTGEADMLRGDADTDAYTLSLYAERNFDSGLFVNGLARYGRLSTDATAGNMDASYDNNAFSLGGNVGYRFTFAEQAFVEPNFGLQYAYVMGDDYKASNGVKVEQDDFDALIASLGARVGFNFPNNAGKLFARASVNHDFLGEIDGTASKADLAENMYVDLGGTWITYGVGTQFNVTDNLSVWGNVDRTTGGEVSTNYMMNAGLRYVF